MLFQSLVCFVILMSCATEAASQDHPPVPLSLPSAAPETVALTVARNTPLQIALAQEVRVKKAGQPLRGRLVQPVFAFDRLVVPAGTEVDGSITRIEPVSGKQRTLGILNADFTPARKIEVEFNQLVLANGRKIPFRSIVTPGSGQVMKLVNTEDNKKRKNTDPLSQKLDQAKQEATGEWQAAMKQIKEPGRMRRVERYAMSQLPARPQYVDAGTLYFAELQEPLDFGSEPLTPAMVASMGTALPEGSVMHALLVTPLDSATSKKGDEVEAVLAQPLFDGDRLVLPEGSRLKGQVLQVQPAGHLQRNGQLRIAFRQIVPPEGMGVPQRVATSLEGVQAAKDDHVKLDSEGGAEATTPKTRYASTAVTLGLTTLAFRQHADDPEQSQNGIAGGAAGFKLVGIVLGAAVKSRAFGMAMGAYGATLSVYTHFISRGRDVVFPRNTAMEIGIGSRGKTVLHPPSDEDGPPPEPKQR
jgi:type IV secretory pathway VirB10-like protein